MSPPCACPTARKGNAVHESKTKRNRHDEKNGKLETFQPVAIFRIDALALSLGDA
jgi:hypothetical protein